jgi:long-chain acyl-CoA synthetase
LPTVYLSSHLTISFESNRYAGCISQSITFATAYDSLGEEGVRKSNSQLIVSYLISACSQLQHSINEPEAAAIFTNAPLLPTLAKVVSDTPSLRVVIFDGTLDDSSKGSVDKIKQDRQDIKIYTLDELIALGKEKANEPNPPTPDDGMSLVKHLASQN